MSKKYAIGIDIGGTNLRAALVSAKGEAVEKAKESSGGDILETLQKIIQPLINKEVLGIGIGVSGLLDRKDRIVTLSPNLHSVEGIDFRKILKKQFEVPVYVENDANAAALGEKWIGAGKEFDNFVLLTLGTGIGSGIIQNNRLADIAAEIGHMSINADGDKCPCGNSGCLELYAAAKAMESKVIYAIEKGTESLLKECCGGSFYKVTGEDIYTYALEGDNLAKEILRETGRYLGVGIANIINILSPQAIILAGGLTGAWNIYVQEAIKEASRKTLPGLFENVKIIPSLLGDDAGIIGSAGMVFAELAVTKGKD
ncbi:MAG: ROK family protein [Nitrospiraceae bacterium]|nr:ROK family protein [Nitrospiraceae bacterium]